MDLRQIADLHKNRKASASQFPIFAVELFEETDEQTHIYRLDFTFAYFCIACDKAQKYSDQCFL